VKKTKITKLISLLLILVFVFTGCGVNSKVVVKVDDEEVKLNELKLYLRLIEKDFEAIGKEDIWETDFDGKTAEEIAKERALESLIKVKVVNKKASNLNLVLSEEDENLVKDQVKSIIEYLGEDTIENIGADNEIVEKMMKESLLANKVFEEATKDFEADQDKIQADIDVDLKDMKETDPKVLLKQVRAKHILIKADDTNKEEAKQTAEGILKRIKDGEDFVSLVKEFSQDEGSIEKDGEYTFPRGQMVPEFEEKAFSMKPGEVSDLVETQFGYHIIKLEEIIEPTEEDVAGFEEKIIDYEKGLREQYIQQQKEVAFTAQYEEWKEAVTIEIKNDEWDKVSISKNEKTE